MKKIRYFELSNGRKPFNEWFKQLENVMQIKINAYIDRVVVGGAKRNIRSLGGGVFEIKIDIGPGYRVYFAEIENVFLLLILGGSKRTQFQDIAMAKKYWREYVQKK